MHGNALSKMKKKIKNRVRIDAREKKDRDHMGQIYSTTAREKKLKRLCYQLRTHGTISSANDM